MLNYQSFNYQTFNDTNSNINIKKSTNDVHSEVLDIFFSYFVLVEVKIIFDHSLNIFCRTLKSAQKTSILKTVIDYVNKCVE